MSGGPKYGEFKYPSSFGFTGSAGRVSVGPYQQRPRRKAQGGSIETKGPPPDLRTPLKGEAPENDESPSRTTENINSLPFARGGKVRKKFDTGGTTTPQDMTDVSGQFSTASPSTGGASSAPVQSALVSQGLQTAALKGGGGVKVTVRKAIGMHDRQEHPGKRTNLKGLRRGGSTIGGDSTPRPGGRPPVPLDPDDK